MSNHHPNQILVPIDFSDQSLIALDQSYNLAREYNAEITLLYVIEDASGLFKFFSKEQDEGMNKEIQAQLDKLADDVEKKSNRKVNTMVVKGRVYEKIVEVAGMLNTVFIIMGTSGTPSGTIIKKRFIGSNALRVVREAKVPVITIKGKRHRNGCKNIVLPLDLTKETKEKVNKAIELAKVFGGSTVRVVSVLFTTDEFIVNRLTRQLAQVKAFIEKADVKCTAEIIKGIKGEETLADNVIDYAKKVEADLILIMTQQETDFTDLFIGSAAQEMIKNSEVPVLSIVPTPKKDTITPIRPY